MNTHFFVEISAKLLHDSPRLKLPRGFFQNLENEDLREFFDEFAKRNHMDPCEKEQWYSVDGRELRKVKVRTTNATPTLTFTN